MSTNSKPIHVIAIVGLSNCGSTVLNILLDSHPQIYGGGELHYLMEKKKGNLKFNLVCTSCLDQCSIWTPERIDAISDQQFYHDISSYTGTNIIVDSSKFLYWFFQRETREKDILILYVICVKHPVRQAASMYLNGQLYNNSLTLDLQYNINRIHGDYFYALQQLENRRKNFVIIQYEKIVENPAGAVNPILTPYSLEYCHEMDNFQQQKHHQLAGNNGAIFVCESKWHPWAPTDKVHDIRRKQYENNRQKGLFMDDKYKEVLTPDQISYIQEDPKIKAFMEKFKYEPIS